MSRECWHCESYSNNQTGCWTKDICLADMMDGTPDWNKKLPHDHKCHREEKLKPCPFCGGEVYLEVYENDEMQSLYSVTCDKCKCVCPSTEWFYAEQEAINTWNQRAERTCEPIDEYFCGVPSCGNCGVTLNVEVSGVRPFNKVLPNYCHNCGAKVVG